MILLSFHIFFKSLLRFIEFFFISLVILLFFTKFKFFKNSNFLLKFHIINTQLPFFSSYSVYNLDKLSSVHPFSDFPIDTCGFDSEIQILCLSKQQIIYYYIVIESSIHVLLCLCQFSIILQHFFFYNVQNKKEKILLFPFVSGSLSTKFGLLNPHRNFWN